MNKIEIPTNPALYYVLTGIIFILTGLTTGISLIRGVLLLLGTLFLSLGLFELTIDQNLEREKKREEINLIKEEQEYVRAKAIDVSVRGIQ